MCRLSTLIVLAICSALNLIGCSSGGDGSQKKYLAKNIVFDGEHLALANSMQKYRSGIFDFSIVAKAYAQSDDIDTETQILAENVIFENTDNCNIESDNVQDALEEISLKLSETIVGTWVIQNYNQEDYYTETGKIIISDDGTFNLLEGSFAAIGMGYCEFLPENQTYEIFTDELMVFNQVTVNNGFLHDRPVIPRLVKLRQNEITFIGSGGCGQVSRQRISILTRED
jgi:hypothetical protein